MLEHVVRAAGINPLLLSDEHVAPFHRRCVLFLTLSAGASAYLALVAAWTATRPFTPLLSVDVAGVQVLAFCCAAAALAMYQRPMVMASVTIAGLVLVLHAWPHQARYLLAPAVVCLAGLLLSRRVALWVAVGLMALPGLPAEGAVGLALTAAATWLALDYIYAALGAASQRQTSMDHLEAQLLSRREELRRLNDSLRNAYTLLERTNHELAEARDEAEEARRLKAEFAATISHELRTPLNLILGFVEVMHMASESYLGAVFTPELRGDVREVWRSAEHLLALVDDVLDLSRAEQARLALVIGEADIGALIREAANTVAGLFRGKPVALRVVVEAGLPSCQADRTRIRQVLVNLLTNAARFTAAGEVVVTGQSLPDTAEVLVGVRDTGPGIPAAERGSVFEAFYQVAGQRSGNRGGTGLGLAICRTFIQMHGGRIWVETGTGRGSQFYFTLPAEARAQGQQGHWSMPGAPNPFGESIVTLDEDGSAARLLERALPGLTVHNVTSAEGLAQSVSEWHPRAVAAFVRGGRGDLGTELGRRLACRGLPIVLCHVEADRPLAQYGNVRAVLNKPIMAPALLLAVEGLGPLASLLVADDDEGMVRFVERTLRQRHPDLRLLTAHDGDRAIELMKRERPEAAILDLAMPGADGVTILNLMPSLGLGHTPVLVLTALDLRGGSGDVASARIEISSALGFSGAEVARYVGAVAEAARPQYAVLPGGPSAEPTEAAEIAK
ncbi:MAG: hybrid sensor histidine kinase/response regulator [Anaerolineae bacterium]